MSDPKEREIEALLASWHPMLDAKIAAVDAEADPEAAPPSGMRPTVGRIDEKPSARRFPPSDGSSLFERLLAAGDDPEAKRAAVAAWEAGRTR